MWRLNGILVAVGNGRGGGDRGGEAESGGETRVPVTRDMVGEAREGVTVVWKEQHLQLRTGLD